MPETKRVTRRITWDIETWTVLEHVYTTDYVGPWELACSGGDDTAKALEKSQAAMTTTLNNDYQTSFGEQQQVLSNLQAKLNYEATNPMGYTPTQLAAARTSINENTAGAAKRALGSAAAFAATHGGSDIGGGATGEIAGEISSAAAQSKSAQLASLAQQNEALKQENMWKGIAGLSGVASEYGGGAGTAISGAGSSANSSVGAGNLLLQSQQAGWADVGGMMSGIAGLGKAFLPGSYTGGK